MFVDTQEEFWNQLKEQIYSAYEALKAFNFQEGSRAPAAA